MQIAKLENVNKSNAFPALTSPGDAKNLGKCNASLRGGVGLGGGANVTP
jgi:hypothetical protein